MTTGRKIATSSHYEADAGASSILNCCKFLLLILLREERTTEREAQLGIHGTVVCSASFFLLPAFANLPYQYAQVTLHNIIQYLGFEDVDIILLAVYSYGTHDSERAGGRLRIDCDV